MDISETLAPKSDQLDAVELLSGPRTFTIERVSRNNDEQPVNVYLAGFPRPWRPGKSMRRVMAKLWSVDASTWVGKSLILYCDERVMFGSEAVGGTRIAAMSDIGEKPRSVPLLVSRGKSAVFVVQPMSRVDALRAEWQGADPERRKAIEAEVNALTPSTPAAAEPTEPDISVNDPALDAS